MFIRLSAFQTAYLGSALTVFARNLKGATAIEYGLIAGGISIVIMVAVFAVGGDLKGMFGYMQTKMSSAVTQLK